MRNGFPSGSGVTWMPARSLGQQKNTSDNKDPDDKRGERTTERETAVADRLVQEVSDRGAEWPREDECCPERFCTIVRLQSAQGRMTLGAACRSGGRLSDKIFRFSGSGVFKFAPVMQPKGLA
jgi:hypothetical protein